MSVPQLVTSIIMISLLRTTSQNCTEDRDDYNNVAADQNYKVSNSEYIWNGLPVDIEEVPYQVYVSTGCGGVIVSRWIVLTAGHCLGRKVVKIGSGSTYLSGLKFTKVEYQVLHPQFKEYGHKYSVYDIGYLKLAKRLKFGPAVQSVKIARHLIRNYDTAIVSGWGLDLQNYQNDDLRFLEVYTYSTKSCVKFLKKSKKIKVPMNVVCSDHEEPLHQPYRGDSGGPLVGREGLIGLVSFGGVDRKDNVVVYTSTAHFRSWIKNAIDGAEK